MQACSSHADIVCQNCTVCPAGTYETAACTATADTECTPCDAGCETCSAGGATDCLSCVSGYGLDAGACVDEDECSLMTDNCDTNASCTNTPGSFTCSCDVGYAGDGVTCAPDSCAPSPLTCRTALGSTLVIRDKSNDDRDRLRWKWRKGEATTQADFADPTASAAYSFCVYAGAVPSLVAEAILPPDAATWAPLGDRGYRYKDPNAAVAGMEKLVLKEGSEGRAKVLVKGRGVSLPDVVLPVDVPVTVQLVNDETGICFEGVYEMQDMRRNEPGKLKARSR